MTARDPIPPTVEWRRGRVRLIDQRALPGRLRFVECASVAEVCDAISSLVVRGAPALGATGAFGVALAARTDPAPRSVRAAAARLRATRPTAVNLARGVDRVLLAYAEAPRSTRVEVALDEAQRLAVEDVEVNRALGAYGAALVHDGARILTHCNAGSLACVGYGTALGVIRAATEAGKRVHVWVGETRPVLQGARLTTWELGRLGIPHALIADTMPGSLMASGDVDLVVVGADRVAANGDVVNKIGTYQLAVLARRHGVPLLVAAPTATVDLSTPHGAAVPIEVRSPDEVTGLSGKRTAPAGVAALNRAFDVTPAALVSAIVTERGIARPPYRRSLRSRSSEPGPAG